MIHQLFNIDKKTPFLLACSGGADSMAIADFYKRGGKQFTIAYFNHGTPQALNMLNVTEVWARQNNVKHIAGSIKKEREKGQSLEEYWRDERYAWLKSFNLPIVTCHHLDDAIETWIFSALRGNPKIIPSKNGLVLRPFLTNTKASLKEWCIRHDVKWFEDLSNKDVHYPRNRIRHNVIPEALKINPGLYKVIKKKVILDLKD
jgi:tRNA(Ile)-lysidine synthase